MSTAAPEPELELTTVVPAAGAAAEVRQSDAAAAAEDSTTAGTTAATTAATTPITANTTTDALSVRSGTELPAADTQSERTARPAVRVASSKSLVVNSGAYKQLMVRQRELWTELPAVLIDYSNLTYTVPILAKDAPIPTVWQQIRDTVTGASLRHQPTVAALHSVSGQVRPGSMTLVLAPPGHGKSVLLKALAGQLQNDSKLSGDIKWNGLDSSAALAAGVQAHRLCAYVDQADAHMPLLTVRETLQFAMNSSTADPALLANPEYEEVSAARVDLMLDVLGLRECEHTILGNAMLRGVSGGQKRRVTLGEMMITNARALLLDEITTGLDSATSFDILQTLRQWTRIMNGSVVTALLQPTPECCSLFDRLILIREGSLLYDGPMDEVAGYLTRIGVPVPDDQDLADFLTDFLADPPAVCERGWKKAESRVNADKPFNQAKPSNLTTATLTASFAAQRADYHSTVELAPLSLTSPFNTALFSSPYSHPFMGQFRLNLKRQAINSIRNKSLYVPRLLQAVVMGLVLGGLFYQFDPASFQARLGLTLFISVFVSFSNAAEIPHTASDKVVVYKQMAAGFYGSPSYALSVFIAHLPLSIVETTVFSLFVYFMTGFAYDAGRFFFFLLALWSISLCSSSIFRMLTYLTPRDDIALQVAGPTIAFLFLFGGYLIEEPKIPRWLIWLFWLSPFSWNFRSVAINEYAAGRYDEPFPDLPYQGIRTGDAYMREWGINPKFAYKWAGIGYMWGVTLIMLALAMAVLHMVRYPVSTGTKRSPDEEQAAQDQVRVDIPSVASPLPVTQDQLSMKEEAVPRPVTSAASLRGGSSRSAASVLPFEPIDLAWKGIKYTVNVKQSDGTRTTRVLLHGIDGFSMAGSLTALVGSSGAGQTHLSSPHQQPHRHVSHIIEAIKSCVRTDPFLSPVCLSLRSGLFVNLTGKTTLMDVIAGRKTQGTIEGSILVNGYPKQIRTFNRLCGYVEQTDVHLATATVREALHFSASLRLASTVTPAQRTKFVEEVLDILELTPIADRVIGDATLPGLSLGQLKRLTIGVELVANPSVLFLDEPTSGLDSRAALVVMRVVKRISSTGRSVLCTIHQPSAELFSMFDRLLLLGKGGVQVYFGPLGEDGEQLVKYVESTTSANNRPQHKPRATNPASWMLDVLASAQLAEAPYQLDFPAAYLRSDLHKRNSVELEEASSKKSDRADVHFSSVYAASVGRQLRAVCFRTFQFYWRNPGMVFLRVFNMLLLSVLFGFLYLKEGVTTTSEVIAQLCAVFVGIAFPGWSSMSVVIPLTMRKRMVFYREQASLIYSPLVYAFSLALVELAYTALATFLFLSCFYEMVGFRNTASAFFHYWLVEYCVLLVIVSLGQLCAAAMPNELVANLMSSLVFTFAFLFSGIYILAGQLPRGWKWLYRIFWIPKALIPIITNQFYCEGADCPQLYNVLSPGGVLIEQQSVSDYLTDFLDTGNWYWQYIGYLILTYAIMQMLVWMAIANINHVKR